MKMNTKIKPTTRQKRYFAVAKANARKSTYFRKNLGKIFIGAAIVKGNYVVSEGYNKNKTHTVQHYNNLRADYRAPVPNIHAEIDALISSRYNDLDGCEIYVYRDKMDGDIGNCRPCRSCMTAMKKAGIKHVYYTDEDGFHYERIN